MVRISDYDTNMLLLNTFGHNAIEISLWIKLPDDLIIRYCFFGVVLKMKFCKMMHMLEPCFSVAVGSYWVGIITEHEYFYVKRLT